MLDLDALVTASRAAAASGDEDAVGQLCLGEVAERAEGLLADIHRRQQEVAGSTDAAELVDDPQVAADQQEMLLCFRIMRNAAAAGPGAAAAVLGAGLLELASLALDQIAAAAIPLNWQLPAAVAQALANLCTASCAAAEAAWAALLPLRFSMLAHINTGPTQAATCLALLSCCRAVDGAPHALVGQQGSEIMTALLCNHQRMLQQGEHNGTLGLLAVHLCFRHDLLPQLLASLGAADDGASDSGALARIAQQPTMAQAVLLEVLCEEAQELPQAQGHPRQAPEGSSGAQRAGASMGFLLKLIQNLAAASKASPLSPGQQQLLQGALHLMRDVCARDDSGRGLVAGPAAKGDPASGGADLVEELQAAGGLQALLAMLKALEPIKSPQQQRQAQQAAGDGPSESAGPGIQLAELAPQLAEAAAPFPSAQPYTGFRSDLLAVLANAAHGRPAVQAAVTRVGGVELVLAQCQLDRHSPLAREYGLWAVRNLCEGNPEAQEAIRQLQLCTTVESEEMQRLGVKLDLDENTGKLRVTKRDPPAGGQPAAPLP